MNETLVRLQRGCMRKTIGCETCSHVWVECDTKKHFGYIEFGVVVVMSMNISKHEMH